MEHLQQVGVTRRQMERRRRQLAAGTLDIGLIPRQNVRMSKNDDTELARAVAQHQELQQEKAKLLDRIAQLEQVIAEKDAANASHAKAVEAIGKAIAAMQKHGDV